MGMVYFQQLKNEIEQVFSPNTITENPLHLPASPFYTLFIEEKNIVFHIIPLNSALLQPIESHFFYNWSTEVERLKIQPIHIWEDRWVIQQPIIISQLASLANATQRVFARNTIAKRITKPVVNDFLNYHHLGGSPASRYKYGLYHKKTSELLGVATFSPPKKYYREDKLYKSYELIRYGSKTDITIIGGLSKLLKAFITEVDPDDIMTYADRDWWTGKSYKPLGFKQTELLAPLEFYVKPPYYLRKTAKHLKKELNLSSQNDFETLAEKGGYIRVFNSGTRKFLLTLK